jgi:hypothetical protein
MAARVKEWSSTIDISGISVNRSFLAFARPISGIPLPRSMMTAETIRLMRTCGLKIRATSRDLQWLTGLKSGRQPSM